LRSHTLRDLLTHLRRNIGASAPLPLCVTTTVVTFAFSHSERFACSPPPKHRCACASSVVFKHNSRVTPTYSQRLRPACSQLPKQPLTDRSSTLRACSNRRLPRPDPPSSCVPATAETAAHQHLSSDSFHNSRNDSRSPLRLEGCALSPKRQHTTISAQTLALTSGILRPPTTPLPAAETTCGDPVSRAINLTTFTLQHSTPTNHQTLAETKAPSLTG
jgi:hypothetical protein